MLRVGLTGGIGSGKSTVAQRFRELGAVVIDADQLAREVVAVGSAGLAAIRQRFGSAVAAPDGSLDRGALGEIVFADAKARMDLEAITHPLIRARTHSLMESALPGEVVVHDVPLLAELDMGAAYHLTVVVGADDDLRVARLTGRGISEADARSRIAAQASDRQRRAVADAWLDNSDTVDALLAQVDALWKGRITGFNDNLVSGSPARAPDCPALVAYDETWPDTAARLIRRVAEALGERALDVEHIGSTSVPGLIANEVIDLQVGVRAAADADDPTFLRALADKGFPRAGDDGCGRLHGSADPGRVVRLHVREYGSPGWESVLLFRDWLAANPTERDAYANLKQAAGVEQDTIAGYNRAREPWIASALERAGVWARHTGWTGR